MSLLAHPAVQEYAEYQVVRGLLGEKEGQSLARPEEKARHEQVSTVLKAEEEGEISTRQAFALLNKLQEPQSQENTEVLTRDELPKMADVLQSRYDSLIKRQSGEMAEGETSRDLLDRVQKETDNENKNERIEAEPKLFETGRFAEADLEERYEKYVKRKIREKRLPKERLEWKKASDYFISLSPVARGNRFNDKAKKRGKI